MSTVWEYTHGCAKKYGCDLDIYLMTVLSSSYGIILDCETYAPSHEKNVVDGLNATAKRSMKEKMELIDKLESTDTSNIVMIPSDSKEA